ILHNPFVGKDYRVSYDKKNLFDFALDSTLDETTVIPYFTGKESGDLDVQVSNTDRAFGTLFGAEVTRTNSSDLEEDTYRIHAHGAGGQSFGAFVPKGVTITLEGDSNDYFGKGLSGGKLAVFPPKDHGYAASENVIIGNVALYGATSGSAYINGLAGERFCVRNSGATAVVEGCGDHGLEYMTGGRAVVLGPVGKNFAAGMSGGVAYVLDEKANLYRHLNKSMVSLESVTDKYDVLELKELIAAHVAATGSEKGKEIYDHFSDYLPKFKKIMPHDYKKMMMTIVQMEEKGLSSEQAAMEAFHMVTAAK
ncbi:MAG: glutamate synthase large subunit, partial [Lachnospiraceae bacterium]|nr:glutamate synthase large subunit [Lachnospiraceae bacterium]